MGRGRTIQPATIRPATAVEFNAPQPTVVKLYGERPFVHGLTLSVLHVLRVSCLPSSRTLNFFDQFQALAQRRARGDCCSRGLRCSSSCMTRCSVPSTLWHTPAHGGRCRRSKAGASTLRGQRTTQTLPVPLLWRHSRCPRRQRPAALTLLPLSIVSCAFRLFRSYMKMRWRVPPQISP